MSSGLITPNIPQETLAAKCDLMEATLANNHNLEQQNAALTAKVSDLETEVTKLQDLLRGRKITTGTRHSVLIRHGCPRFKTHTGK